MSSAWVLVYQWITAHMMAGAQAGDGSEGAPYTPRRARR